MLLYKLSIHTQDTHPAYEVPSGISSEVKSKHDADCYLLFKFIVKYFSFSLDTLKVVLNHFLKNLAEKNPSKFMTSN